MLGVLEPRFELASSKLSALEKKLPTARWPKKVASIPARLPLIAPTIDADYLAAAQMALMNERQLTGRYYSAHRNKASDLVLNPLGLVQRGPITYLVATAVPCDDASICASSLERSDALNSFGLADRRL